MEIKRNSLGRFENGHGFDSKTLEKMRNAKIGKKLSEEHKRKLSKNHSRWNKGIPMSEEAKRKLSKARKGKILFSIIKNCEMCNEEILCYTITQKRCKCCKIINERLRFKEKLKNPIEYAKHRVRSLARKVKLKEVCQICGSKDNLQKHHPDYNKPLEVITLCPKCHSKVHRRLVNVSLRFANTN